MEHAAPARADAQKKTLVAAERTRPDIAAARESWNALKPSLDVRHLVFIDETWTKTNMTRLRGRAPRGRTIDRRRTLRALEDQHIRRRTATQLHGGTADARRRHQRRRLPRICRAVPCPHLGARRYRHCRQPC